VALMLRLVNLIMASIFYWTVQYSSPDLYPEHTLPAQSLLSNVASPNLLGRSPNITQGSHIHFTESQLRIKKSEDITMLWAQ
jgi:hypothetical protein